MYLNSYQTCRSTLNKKIVNLQQTAVNKQKTVQVSHHDNEVDFCFVLQNEIYDKIRRISTNFYRLKSWKRQGI